MSFYPQPDSHHEMIGNDETKRNELASQCCVSTGSMMQSLELTSCNKSVKSKRPGMPPVCGEIPETSRAVYGYGFAGFRIPSLHFHVLPISPVFYLFTYHSPSPVPEEVQLSKFLNLVPFPIPRVASVRFWQRKPLQPFVQKSYISNAALRGEMRP